MSRRNIFEFLTALQLVHELLFELVGKGSANASRHEIPRVGLVFLRPRLQMKKVSVTVLMIGVYDRMKY